MSEAVLLGAAALTGLLGSPHCAMMCGGIASGFPTGGRPASLARALQPNLGRLTGYAIAGALAGGVGHGIVALLDSQVLRIALRTLAGLVLLLLAFRLAGRRIPFTLDGPARLALAPLQRLRVRRSALDTVPGRFLAGLAWGWLPCGLSTSLLTLVWLRADAGLGALVMLAFGLGGLPAMTSLSWAGARLGSLGASPLRPVAVAMVTLSALLTAASPWLLHVPRIHRLLASLGCAS